MWKLGMRPSEGQTPLIEMGFPYQVAAVLTPKPEASKEVAWPFPFPRGLVRISIVNKNQKPESIGVWKVQVAGFSL